MVIYFNFMLSASAKFFQKIDIKLKVLEVFSGNGVASMMIYDAIKSLVTSFTSTDILDMKKFYTSPGIEFGQFSAPEAVERYGAKANVLLMVSPIPGNHFQDLYAIIGFMQQHLGTVFFIVFVGELGASDGSEGIYDYMDKHPEVEIISWSSIAKKGEKKIGDTQRDKLYKLVVKKQGNLKDEDIVYKDGEFWAYLKGYNPLFEEVQGDSIVCDGCGWTWKIEDGGSDLYICHKCGHDNTPK